MRIAMLGHKRIPSREGGVEVVVEALSTRMAALGHEVTTYNRRGGGAPTAPSRCKGVRIETVPTLDKRGLAAMTSSFFAACAVAGSRPDVAHFHAEGPCAMIPIAKAAGVRTVATIHGLDWQRAKWGRFASWFLRLGERTAAKHADEVIVLSRNMQRYFEAEYGRRTRFIPNGVDAKKRVEPRVIARRHGLEEGSYVLFVGRIVPEKGLRRLIEAFKKTRTSKKLVVAGGPSDSREYYEEVRSSAAGDGRILLVGFVEGRELEELYSNAYLYVLPSDVEGMPMSLLEAMAYGRCCLTSDIPECSEVLGGAGSTFAAGDAESLRAQLERLLNDPEEVASLSAKAVSRAGRYGWDSVVGETLDLYEGHFEDPEGVTSR